MVPERDRLVALLDSVTDAVFTLDRDTRLTYLNRAAVERLGRPVEAMLGRHAAEVLPPVDGSAFGAAYARAFATGEPIRAEAWVPDLAGWFEVQAFPAAGSLTVVFRETTERRRRDLARLVRDALVAALEPEAGPVDSLLAIARTLRGLTDCALVEVWVRDHPRGELRLAGTEHDPGDDRLAAYLRRSRDGDLRGSTVPDRVLESGVPELVEDLTDRERSPHHDSVEHAGLHSSIHLPVVVEGSPPAVVGLSWRRRASDTDWFALLTHIHPDLIELVARQRERHDLVRTFNLTSDMVAVAGFDGYFKRINPRVSEVLGYTQDELLDRPFIALVHPDDHAATYRVVERLRSGTPVRGFRNRFRTADGRICTLSWDCHPIPHEGVIYCVARDVTVDLLQRQLEETQRRLLAGIVLGEPLARTCEDLVAAVEERFPGALVSMHRYDPDANLLRLLAAPSLPAAYREASDPFPVAPGAGSCGSAAHARATVIVEDLANDERFAEHRAVVAATGLVSSWSEPVLGADGELLGTFAVHRRRRTVPDATERRVLADLANLAGVAIIQDRAHRQLSDSEQRFRLLSHATSDGVWDWDVASGRVERSESFATLFGYAHDEVPSDLAAWSSRIHDEDRARVVAGVREALDGDDDTWQDTYRFVRADGTVSQVVDRGTIIRDDGGRAVRVVGALVDDSDRHELEQQYLRAQRLESIGTLAGGIAHDLNNVLAPILMATDLLALDELGPEQQELVEMIAASAGRGASMVRQVLTFARGVSTERRPVDVGELLVDVERMARDTFPKSIDVEVHRPAGALLVSGDEVQLQQVLINVAVNARDAMPDGGTLRLEAQLEDVDGTYAEVAGARAGRHVRITVEDTGTGMDETVLERIFEPFFTTKEPGRGTGLGMSSSHTIVLAHLGFIEVDSEVGRGTTFRIRLPATSEVLPVTRPAATDDAPRGGGELVLVVDDEASVRAVTQQTLETAGYRVATARDGAHAVAVYAGRVEEIDLVLTDVMMPVMDGAAAINALRRIDPDVRVIATSGLTAHLRGLTEPAAFLAKPFTTGSLLRAVAAELTTPSGGD